MIELPQKRPLRTRETLLVYWRHARPYLGSMIILALVTWSAIGIDLYRPWVYKKLVDTIAAVGTGSDQLVWRAVGVIAGLSLLSIALRRIRDWVNIGFQTKVKQRLLRTCFLAVHQHAYHFITDQFVGGLVRKVNRYDRSFEELADQLIWGLGQTAIQTVGLGIGLYIFSPLFFWIFVVWLIGYVGYTFKVMSWKRALDLKKSEEDSAVTAQLADGFTNFHTIKVFASLAREARAFYKASERFRLAQVRSWRASWWLELGQSVWFTSFDIGAISLAVILWSRGQLTVGDIALIQMYSSHLVSRLWDLGNQIRYMSEALADANEMTAILHLPREVVDQPTARALLVSQGEITFDRVSFKYGEGARVVQGFTLTIPAKQKVALVGPSGGGKTTITKLLLRLYDVEKGSICIDNQNIAHVTQVSLRQHMSYVPQEPVLFHRTLLENIGYGKDNATKSEIVHAAKLAHAHEFISRLENGYETLVGERGVKLSGGERQRVAIARAILKNAPILILDEATSSLDSESERYIQKALSALMQDKTVLVIAHRLSTIMQMDRIIVLDRGRIIEDGTHHELLKVQQGTYQKLWEIQAGSFAESAQ